MLPTTLGIWLGVVHAESNPLYAHPVEPTKSCGSAQCFNVSASADRQTCAYTISDFNYDPLIRWLSVCVSIDYMINNILVSLWVGNSSPPVTCSFRAPDGCP